MVARLTLVSHAATEAVRAAAFPLDEPIEFQGRLKLSAFGSLAMSADRQWTSPALRARQTAEVLLPDAVVEPLVRDCDYGDWSGRSLDDLQSEQPAAVTNWLADPAAAPHGGESLLALLRRIGGWLDAQVGVTGRIFAITHAAVIRAAVLHAIEAPPRAFWRIDVPPLSMVTLSGNHGHWTLRSIGPLPDRQRQVPVPLAALVVMAVMAIASITPAAAHRQGPAHAASADAILVPSLTHGQMAIIARNRMAILDLVARQMPTDRVMRRLQGFINIQYSTCLWGLMPGSLDDETSPFNECTHAYLAGTQALLLHLQTMPGDREPARALLSRIDIEMLANDSARVLCRYSGEPFNTSEVIAPHWSEVPSHVPSLATFAGVALMATGLAWLLWRWCRAAAGPIGAKPRYSPA